MPELQPASRKSEATGKYKFAYMRTQDCRQLKIKRVKKRPTGFAVDTETASSSGVSAGEAAGGLFPWACAVLPGNRNTGEVEPGQTASTSTVEPGRTGTTGTCQGEPVWLGSFRFSYDHPDRQTK
eukprot:1173297-Amphidinium_carterae.1